MSTKYRWIWIGIAFLFFSSLFRMAVPEGWDESFYISQLSSAALDRDLMLQNDLLMFKNPMHEKIRSAELLNREGYHLNAFSVGPALFYSVPVLPIYAGGAARFGLAFQQGIALWTALFWFFGLLLLFDFLSYFETDDNSKFLALFAAVFSTPFILYGTRFYLTAHFLSSIIIIFTLYLWISWLKSPSYLTAWAMGLVSGMLVITRWESGVFFISFILPILFVLKSSENRMKRLTGLFIAAGIALVMVFLQMTIWKIQLNHWICMPQDSGFMLWTSPSIVKFLLSGYHGVLLWSPGLIIGFLGLLFYGRKIEDPIIRKIIPGLLLYIIIQTYISAAAWDWWGGSSYGPRRLTLLLAPAAMGWVLVLKHLRGWLKVVPVIAVIIWSGFTLSAYRWQVDDLTLLLTGHADVFRPDSSPVTPEMIENRWVHWKEGFRHMRVPGFALKNHPTIPHRRSGCAILLAIFILGELFRRFLKKNDKLKFTVLFLITVYVLSISLIMLSSFPRNETWQKHWKSIVSGNRMKAPGEFPKGYKDAMNVIGTIRMLKSSDHPKLIQPDELYGNSLPGITLEELIDYSKSDS